VVFADFRLLNGVRCRFRGKMRFFWWGSNNDQGQTPKAAQTFVMRCHYEVLGVPRDATAEEITRAFRRAALRLHPDKNPDRPEEAAEAFKELRRAYEVLSDPHERKWYDDHREDILRGRDPLEATQAPGTDTGAASRTERTVNRATELNIYEYFRSSAYNGYEDGERGFYHVYGAAFEQLAREEVAAGGAQPPPFGSATADWPSVRRFYNFWENFVSAKTFAFADSWNPSEAPNREIRRAIERDNRRERERARREFQALVRELVAFVKKRDRRVLKHKEEEARKEAEKLERQVQEREQWERLRSLHAARLAAQLEEDIPNLEELLEHLEYAGISEEAPDVNQPHGTSDAVQPTIEGVQCLACKKYFKTFAQWENHEHSKKHRDCVRRFRKDLCLAKGEEVQVFRIMGQVEATGDEDHVYDVVNGDAHPNETMRQRASSERQKKPPDGDGSLCEGQCSEDEQAGVRPASSVEASSESEQSVSRRHHADDDDDDEIEDDLAVPVGTRNAHSESDPKSATKEAERTRSMQDAHMNGKSTNAGRDIEAGTHAAAHTDELRALGDRERSRPHRRRAETAKDRRRRRHLAAATAAQNAGAAAAGAPAAYKCQTCSELFTSRNALFRHIREQNHAQYR
jgi:DnaJ family protein A protein 5